MRPASARLSAIVTSVARALSLPVVSCAAWLDAVDAPFVGVARKVRYLHRKDGWEIRSGEGIAVASRSVPLDALAWPPRDLGALCGLHGDEGRPDFSSVWWEPPGCGDGTIYAVTRPNGWSGNVSGACRRGKLAALYQERVR